MTRVGGVISAHTQAPWIEEAVRTLHSEVDELVVVDDRSRDSTPEILRSLASELRFTLIEHSEALGVSASYNEAVEAIDAEIVLIQGGDDRTLPGRAAATAAALSDPAIRLVDSLPLVIDAAGLVLPAETAGEFLTARESGDVLGHLFSVGNFVCAPAVGVRRADYLSAGGFPLAIDLLQDYALWLRLLEEGGFRRLPDPVVEYRKHASNASREQSGIDTPQLRRSAAERDWIRNRFLDTASRATIHRLGPIPGRPAASELSREDAALLLRLASGDRALTRRGLSDLFTLLGQEPGALARLGIDRAELGSLSVIADHDGGAEFGRGVAIARRLAREC